MLGLLQCTSRIKFVRNVQVVSLRTPFCATVRHALSLVAPVVDSYIILRVESQTVSPTRTPRASYQPWTTQDGFVRYHPPCVPRKNN